jgi:endonuclease/exonuclease/phosphatase family metal-dependent hydrolase
VRLRVATYNVRGFRSGVDRVAAVVAGLSLDVLLVQESGPRRALVRFADAVGMEAATDPISLLRRRVKNAVLARPPWRIVEARLERFEGSRLWYPRGGLVASLVRGEQHLTAVSVHLGLDGGERGRHVGLLLQLAAGFRSPVVLAGDLNATPERRAPITIAAAYADVWPRVGVGGGETFPAGAPVARIDYLFVTPDVELVRASVGAPGAAGASDHLPVVVELVFPGGTGSDAGA